MTTITIIAHQSPARMRRSAPPPVSGGGEGDGAHVALTCTHEERTDSPKMTRSSRRDAMSLTDAQCRTRPSWRRFELWKWLLIGVAVAAGRLAGAGAAGVPAVAELPDAADRDRAGAVFTLENYRTAYFSAETFRLFLQLAAIRARQRGARALPRHCARLDQRAHQHAVQDAVLRACDHSAGDPGHPVHGVVDHAGEPEDRHPQSRAAARCSIPTPCSSTSTP